MEDEICQFDKFGYCKYKKECRKRHFSEECQELSNCKSIKTCSKRHPKACTRHKSGQCRFEKCAYKHQEPHLNQEQLQMAAKIKQLDEVIHALTRKVLELEKEIKDKKKKDTSRETFKGFGHDGKGIEVKDVTTDKNFKPKICSSPKEKEEASKVKVKQDKMKKIERKEVFFTCDNCDFKSKKEEHLKKHKITKHEDSVCQVCKEKFKSFMELLKHVAKNHSQEPDQKMKLQGEDKTVNEAEKEDVKNNKHHSKESAEDTEIKDTEKEGLALSESMLDDVLLAGY